MKLPLPQSIINNNTISSNHLFKNDFIIIAEFCEQKGPNTVLILPNEKVADKFPVQKYISRVLAGDHTRKQDKQGDNCTWIMPEDTQLYLTDSMQGYYSYVHHLTLHDIHARGYVRPLVICYITNEKEKIMNHFEFLLFIFSQVSNTLKYGNNCKFLNDLNLQLNGIQQLNFNEYNKEEEDFEKNHFKKTRRLKDIYEQLFYSISHETFDQVLLELKDLRKKFINYLQHDQELSELNINQLLDDEVFNNKIMDNISLSFSSTHHSVDSVQIFNSPKTHQLLINDNNEFTLLYENGLSTSTDTLKCYMPTILRCIHKSTNFDAQLRSISEVCGKKFYETSVQYMLNILEHFHRKVNILDIENYDMDIINHNDINSMLFIGRYFILDLNIENGYHYPPSLKSNLHLNNIISPFHSSTTTMVDHFNDSYDNGSTDDSISDDQVSSLSSFNEDNDLLHHHSLLSTINISNSLNNSNNNNNNIPSYSPTMNHQSSSLNNEILIDENHLTNKLNERYSIFRNGFKGTGCYVNSVFEYEKHDELFSEIKRRKRLSGETNLSFNNNSNSLLSSSIFDYYVGESNFGKGILYFFREYSFVKDIAYSLMIGRPVIIYSDKNNEKLVRTMVNAFALFIPGFVTKTDNHFKVSFWQMTCPNMIDLTKYKLIGLSKEALIPKHFKTFVTIFDVEAQILHSPAYSGVYLDIVFDESKDWGSEEAFLSFTHAIFLEMGMKASLYHQLHSLTRVRGHFYRKSLSKIPSSKTKERDGGKSSIFNTQFPNLAPQHYHKPNSNSSGHNGGDIHNSSKKKRSSPVKSTLSIGSGGLETMRDCSKDIQSHLGLRGCDCTIVEYLVDLIHSQEASSAINSSNNNTLKLQSEPVLTHLNKRK